ncbi:MAG TPA: lipase [Rhizobiaceae bacterium]
MPSTDVGRATFVTVSEADSWRVTTEFYFLGLDSIVMSDAARPLPVRVSRYLVAFFDYWLTGTAFSIFAKSWRFGLYFLYPFVVIVLFFLLALLASSAALAFAGMNLPGASALIAFLAVFPLLATLGRRWSVTHLIDLWSFSQEYVRGRRPGAEALLERHAAIAAEATAASQFDEILFVGHSTGGGLILDMASRTLDAAPDLARRAPEVSLLTLGSTALKFGLHPAGAAYRKRVQSLADEAQLKWSEFQCLTDVINFYKTNPLRDMGLKAREHSSAFPIVRKIHLRDMLGKAAYARVRGRFFRVHYQFISANRRKYYYDFFRICFGPVPTSAMRNDPLISVFPDREAAL